MATWCFHWPGFEELLLAELQRQQQCSQFCDTLLRADGVSVPVHSCIVSAMGPRLSNALSAMPAPPSGQRRLLDFGTLGARTLLRLVRLLYSGEMVGEGEEEKREAVSAAAKMGIHGLVEKKKGRRDSWTQTEEQQDEAPLPLLPPPPPLSYTPLLPLLPPPPPPPLSPLPPTNAFETIDFETMQSLGQMDGQIPYVPISVTCPQHEAQMVSSTLAAMPLHPCPPPVTTWAPDPQSCWATPKYGAAEREWQDEQLEQFDGNIPGFINHFLDPHDKEVEAGAPRGGRGRRARRGQGGEQPARRPRSRRGRRGLTETVDVQEVGGSRTPKVFLQRGGTRVGQGGGAVGRKLQRMSRELRRPYRKQAGKSQWQTGGGASTQPAWSGRQFKQDPGPAHRTRAAEAPPPPPPPPLPPLPPQEEQPEHFERLLEEVMMGLNILPKRRAGPAAAAAPPTGRRAASPQNKQRPASAAGVKRRVRSGNSEGEITEMLDSFLQSFEQPADNGAPWEEDSGQVREPPASKAGRPEPHGTPGPSAASSPSAASCPARPKRRKRSTYLFSLEKRSLQRKPSKLAHARADEQLRRIPVVQLERSGALPPNMRLQDGGGLEVKSPSQRKASPSVRAPKEKVSPMKVYSLRSKFQNVQVQDLQPKPPERRPKRRHRPIKVPEPCRPPDYRSPPQQDKETPMDLKRPSEGAIDGAASAAKQVRCDRTSPPPKPAEDVIDVETISLSSFGLAEEGAILLGGAATECLTVVEEDQSDEGDEIIDVDGDSDCSTDVEGLRRHWASPDDVKRDTEVEEEEEEEEEVDVIDVMEGKAVLVAAGVLSKV